MFSTKIDKHPFTDERIGRLKEKIPQELHDLGCVDAGIIDNSWIATLRAILIDKVNKSKPFTLRLRTAQKCWDRLVFSPEKNSLTVHLYSCGESAERVEEYINTGVESNPGYEHIDKVKDFFKGEIDVWCFVNRETRDSHVVVRNVNIKTYHKIQTGMIAYVPWFFESMDDLTEGKIALLKSLGNKTDREYIAHLERVAEENDLREIMVEEFVRTISQDYKEKVLAEIQSDIDRLRYSLNVAQDEVNRTSAQLYDRMLEHHGAVNTSGSSEQLDNFVDYLKRRKDIYVNIESDKRIGIAIGGTLDYFDEDMAETLIGNKQSYLYSHANEGHKERLGELLKAIFITRELKLSLSAYFVLGIDGSVITKSAVDTSKYIANSLPNPHHFFFACMGNYLKTINEAMREGDLTKGAMLCEASARTLNLEDFSVMTRFTMLLCGHEFEGYKVDDPCFTTEDGELLTLNEAYAWLKERNKENGEDNQAD